MIDVCLVIHKNYDLLWLQLEQWKNLTDFRLLIADNTPPILRQPIGLVSAPHRLFTHEVMGDDGETHGGTLDFLVKQSESEFVGVCDSDFFIVHPDPWSYIYPYFQRGCQVVGVESLNQGWLNRHARIDAAGGIVPSYCYKGYTSPCVFCCFFTRSLALSETFVVTHYEGRIERKETGWRFRHKILDANIPNHVIRGFQYPGQEEILWDSYYFGTPEEPFGVHLTAGCGQPRRVCALPALLNLAEKNSKRTLS